MSKASPLKEFHGFLEDYRKIIWWVAAGAGAGPMLDLFFVQFGSPWPSSMAASIAAVFVELLALIIAYEFWRKSKVLAGHCSICLLPPDLHRPVVDVHCAERHPAQSSGDRLRIQPTDSRYDVGATPKIARAMAA